MSLTWESGTVDDLEALRCEKELDVPGLYHQEWARILLDGEVVAVWGLLMRWPHVADLCGCVHQDKVRGRHGLALTRMSRALLRTAAYGLRLRRITAFVEADREEYRRFAAGAGFEPEGMLAEAGPDGADLIIYTRKFPWAALSAASSEAERKKRRPRRPHLRLITAPCGGTIGSGPVTRAHATTPT